MARIYNYTSEELQGMGSEELHRIIAHNREITRTTQELHTSVQVHLHRVVGLSEVETRLAMGGINALINYLELQFVRFDDALADRNNFPRP